MRLQHRAHRVFFMPTVAVCGLLCCFPAFGQPTAQAPSVALQSNSPVSVRPDSPIKAPYSIIRAADTLRFVNEMKSRPLGEKAFNAVEIVKYTPQLPLRVQAGATLKPFVTSFFESHDAADHIFVQLEGSQTVFIGGRLVNPTEKRKGYWLATKAEGYDTVILNKGDMLVIPRGVPHGGESKEANSAMVLTFGDHG